jgi:uncharacterized protein YqjF (DUF2071 family)
MAVPCVSKATSQPPRRWRWSQHWRDLFFAHWQTASDELLPFLPHGVDLDIRDGAAWLSAVAFRLEAVRPRWFPPVGPASNFLELNLRTYIRWQNEPAIFFLSIHANSRTAIVLARWLTPLPYVFARIDYTRTPPLREFVAGSRPRVDEPLFRAEFRPIGAAEETTPSSLDDWLLERYVAVIPDRRGRLKRMTAWHPRWRLHKVRSRVTARGLGRPWGVDLERTPDLCHFASGVDALISPFAVLPARTM